MKTMVELAQERDVEEAFVKALRELMAKHKPKGIWETWSGDGRVIILKRKPDGSNNP